MNAILLFIDFISSYMYLLIVYSDTLNVITIETAVLFYKILVYTKKKS